MKNWEDAIETNALKMLIPSFVVLNILIALIVAGYFTFATIIYVFILFIVNFLLLLVLESSGTPPSIILKNETRFKFFFLATAIIAFAPILIIPLILLF